MNKTKPIVHYSDNKVEVVTSPSKTSLDYN